MRLSGLLTRAERVQAESRRRGLASPTANPVLDLTLAIDSELDRLIDGQDALAGGDPALADLLDKTQRRLRGEADALIEAERAERARDAEASRLRAAERRQHVRPSVLADGTPVASPEPRADRTDRPRWVRREEDSEPPLPPGVCVSEATRLGEFTVGYRWTSRPARNGETAARQFGICEKAIF